MGKHNSHAPYNRPYWFTLMVNVFILLHQFILLTVSYLICRSDGAYWCARFLSCINLATTGINLLQQISKIAQNMSVYQRSWNKRPAQDDSYHWLITFKQWHPMPTPVPHCQLARFEHSSSPLHQMLAFLLVKPNESHVILCNSFHTWKPTDIGSTPTSWSPQNLTYDGRNCFMFRFLAPNPTKELGAP
jgi:hypothetical protein